MHSGSKYIFETSLFAILGLVFSPISAFAGFNFVVPPNAGDTVWCTEGGAPGASSGALLDMYVTPHTTAPMQAVSMYIFASSTIATTSTPGGVYLNVFKNGTLIGTSTAEIGTVAQQITWDISPLNIVDDGFSEYRFSVYDNGAGSRYMVAGQVATVTNARVSYNPGGAPTNPCTIGAQFIQIGTQASVTYKVYSTQTTDVSCNTFDIGCYFSIALEWAFKLPDGSFDKFTDLKDAIKDHAPFGYFTAAVNAVGSFSTTSTSSLIDIPTPIQDTIFTPLRVALVVIVAVAGLIWLYRRLSNIVI